MPERPGSRGMRRVRSLMPLSCYAGSLEFPAIYRGCPARRLSKSAAERTDLGIAQAERDVRDRVRPVCQKQLGGLHASLHLVLMRRRSERLLECPAKMMLAEPREFRELRQRDLLSQMLLDVSDHSALLPAGEASTIDCRKFGQVSGRISPVLRVPPSLRMRESC